MEFPFGHHHHDHHHRPENTEEDPNRYPPPGHQPYEYNQSHPPPPPPQQYYGDNVYGRPEYPPPPPPQQYYSHNVYGRPEYPPPPPPVQHVSHEVGPEYGYGGGGQYGHHHRPFSSSSVHHVGHEGGVVTRQPTVRIFTKAEERYSLSIRDGNVVLALADPRNDYQHWIKDLRYSTKVKDEEGFPSFALINKVTGQALKHSIGATHPVRLVTYNPDYLDESVLWTESKDLGDGFRCIRMVNNIRLNFDAFHGDEDHGGVHDGTTLVLWEWLKGKNQRWKIVPY